MSINATSQLDVIPNKQGKCASKMVLLKVLITDFLADRSVQNAVNLQTLPRGKELTSKFAEEAGALCHSSKLNVLLFGHMTSRQLKVTAPPPQYKVLSMVQSIEKQGLAIATALTRGTMHRPRLAARGGAMKHLSASACGPAGGTGSLYSGYKVGLVPEKGSGQTGLLSEGTGSAHSFSVL